MSGGDVELATSHRAVVPFCDGFVTGPKMVEVVGALGLGE